VTWDRRDKVRANVKRPPTVIVLIALLMMALGETSGAVMSQLRDPFAEWARARVAANATVHGLSGSVEYDDEIRGRAVFAAEAGLSFFHTHAEGLGVIVFAVSTVTATVVPWARVRAVLHALVGLGGLFPLGYLVYAVAVLERGRDDGIELAERWALIPLGSAMIVGLVALVVATAVVVARRRPA
jgi:hypothetical protein